MQVLRNYHSAAGRDAARLKQTIADLRRHDAQHAYLLRNCLQHAMQDFLSAENIKRANIPNANKRSGFETQVISGPQVRYVEFQFLSRLTLFEFDTLLIAFDREVDQLYRPWPMAWKQFGCLRFERPITPRAAAKMNVVQLGLMARLSSRLRDFTSGRGICAYGTGQPVPAYGRPGWSIVAELINCALDLQNPLTGETAQRVWNKFYTEHSPTMQAWPKPAKQEPQVQKN